MSFNDYAKSIIDSLSNEIKNNAIQESSFTVSRWIQSTSDANKLITIFGNGGSAADAQHWAAELSGTFRDKSRVPLKAIALTTDTSVITALANDFDYSRIFSRQINALGISIGLAIGLSTSGNSLNVIKGLESAKKVGAKTILISGLSPCIFEQFDMHIKLNAKDTASIQTLTQIFYHSVCENLES